MMTVNYFEVFMPPKIDLSDCVNKIAKLNGAIESVGEVFANTFKDIASRAPGKIASAVTAEYNIKKKEIKPSNKYKIKKAGSITVHGQNLTSLEFRYAGRLLTLTHFPMTPKTRPDKKRYKIKAKVKKQQKVINAPEGGGVFLAPAAKSATILPWMRFSKDKLDIAPIKTLSLPQMVDNDNVREQVNKDLSELVDNRFQHNLKRHLDKKLKG